MKQGLPLDDRKDTSTAVESYRQFDVQKDKLVTLKIQTEQTRRPKEEAQHETQERRKTKQESEGLSYLLCCGSNRVEANVCEEDHGRPSKDSVHAVRSEAAVRTVLVAFEDTNVPREFLFHVSSALLQEPFSWKKHSWRDNTVLSKLFPCNSDQAFRSSLPSNSSMEKL